MAKVINLEENDEDSSVDTVLISGNAIILIWIIANYQYMKMEVLKGCESKIRD